MIVSDTNLLVYLYVESEFTPLARQVHTMDPDWVFPPVVRSEATNVLATLARQEWITVETAAVTLERIEPCITAGSRDVPMKAVLTLAIKRGISAYDAQFIALAERLGVSFVTEDGGLKRHFPDVAVSMKSFVERVGRTTIRETRAVYGARRRK